MLEIDINKIKQLGLSLEEGVCLYFLIQEDKAKLLLEFEEILGIEKLNNIIKSLETNGFIKQSFDDIILLSKTKEHFIQIENFDFSEFFDTYPVACPNGRILRTVGHDTQIYKICKKKYLSKVKDKKTHEKIINTLKSYFNVIHSDQLNYLNNLETFINKRGWETMETFNLQNNVIDMRNDI